MIVLWRFIISIAFSASALKWVYLNYVFRLTNQNVIKFWLPWLYPYHLFHCRRSMLCHNNLFTHTRMAILKQLQSPTLEGEIDTFSCQYRINFFYFINFLGWFEGGFYFFLALDLFAVYIIRTRSSSITCVLWFPKLLAFSSRILICLLLDMSCKVFFNLLAIVL